MPKMSKIKEIIDKYQFKIDRLKYQNKVTILETREGRYVVKKKNNKDIDEVFRYLKSKRFFYYLESIYDDPNYMIFPYLNNISQTQEEKAKEMISILSLLHGRTSFYKSFSLDEIKKFYEKSLDHIEVLYRYYDNLRINMEEQPFPSPSNYYILRNISWIFHSLDSSKYFLEKWYELIQNKKSRRICLNHGNLELSHLLGDENEYLISWEKAHNDLPIYDLLLFYKRHFKDVSFAMLIPIYEEKTPLLQEEKFLLFSLMLLPYKIQFQDMEILNTKNSYYMIEYLKTSAEIISQYHPTNAEAQAYEHQK